jgi:tRNA-2-methylthio-N6-dimethylallyladenosine synthase
VVKYYLQTYGCQMNVHESGLVRRVLGDAGYTEATDESEADVLLMMTCSVRSHAEQRALGRLGAFRARRAERPGTIVGVLGCMAQRFKDVLVHDHGADLVVGPDEYLRLPALLRDALDGRGGSVAVRQMPECYDDLPSTPHNPVSAYITVMRGCDNYCTYCIVPYVKGRERSRPFSTIVRECIRLAADGIKEITLLGQNVLAYRDGGRRFPDLLLSVARSVPGVRVRFLTSHPRDLDERLLEAMAETPNVCPAIHLPLQSGSDRILRLMNRGYSCREYLDKIELCRRILARASLSTDVIVGFPSETEDDFSQTLETVHAARFDFAYMFRYSLRPGTKAADISPRVSEADGGRRLARLIEMQNRVTSELSREMLSEEFEVLVEGPSPRGKGWLARTRTNKVIILNGPAEVGDLVRCRVTQVNGWTPIAERLEPVPAAM